MKRSKKLFFAVLSVFLLTVLFCVSASADMGPKPSIHVTLNGLGDEECYATLLSKSKSTGPHSAWDGNEDHIYLYDKDHDIEIWRAFAEYEDEDGFYFLQDFWRVDQTKEFRWGYYPPYTFKVLLYYPESGTFVAGEICERYAFDSYFTFDFDNDTLETSTVRSYRWQEETVSLVARILITIALEMGIALLFGFRGKRSLVTLMIVNTATQVGLNVALNVINFNSGQFAFVAGYVLLELLIIVVEAILYVSVIKRNSETPKRAWFYVVYAIVANVISFAAGLGVAEILPGIF